MHEVRSPIDGTDSMNILFRDQQIAVISALTEGCSIRATRAANRHSPAHHHEALASASARVAPPYTMS